MPIIVSKDNYAIHIWDTHNAAEIQTLRADSSRIMTLQFSPDGAVLAAASVDHRTRLWDVRKGVELHSLDQANTSTNSLAFSADGSRLAVGNFDGTIQVAEVQ